MLGTLAAWMLVALQTPADAPPRRPLGWDDFPVFVWREQYAGKPLPEELLEPFGGTLLVRDEPSDWCRAKGCAYLVFNAAGRSPLHLDADDAWNARVEKWIETHDEKLLVREPCLNDPEVRARLSATLQDTLDEREGDYGLGMSLGDEVSWTPGGDPFDLCRCAHCESLWRAYASEHDLPERAPLTDEVRTALLDDDYALLRPWIARRRFDQQRMQEVLDDLLRVVMPERSGVVHRSAMLRETPIGLLGCTGQTPFSGVALEELAPRLNFIECYPFGDARELVETVPDLWRHRPDATFGPDPRPFALTTLFVEGETPAGLAWLVWQHWVSGGNGLVLWSDTQLGRLSEAQRERLDRAVLDVRALEHETFSGPRSPDIAIDPRPGCIALLHDPDSDAAAFLKESLLDGATWPRRRASYQEQHGSRNGRIRSWIRLVQDDGSAIASLPLERFCADCTRRYPVIVAPEILVIDESEIRQLERHVDEGGVLVVDGPIGWVDRQGRPYADDVLERLQSHVSGRVLTTPSSLDGYADARVDRARREHGARFLREVYARVDRTIRQDPPPLGGEHVRPPELGEDAARFSWLCGRSGFEQARLYALLPNCPTRAERAGLRDLLLAPKIPDDYSLRWLHPAEGELLPAGDAAVFVLTPVDADEPQRSAK